MELSAEQLGDIIVVHVNATRIDAAAAIQFKDRLKGLAQGGPDRVILDLNKVTFIDSSGLGAIVAAMKQLAGGQKLELANLTNSVQKVFRLTRMDSVFRIHSSLSSVQSALPRAS